MATAALLATAACSGPGDTDTHAITDEAYGARQVLALAGSVVSDNDSLAMPGDLAIIGDHLLVVDIYGESSLRLLDRSSGRLVDSFGRRGEGPGEFAGIWTVDPAWEDDEEFWVYDFALSRLTRLAVAEAAPGSVERPVRAGLFPAGDSPAPKLHYRGVMNLRSEGLVVQPAWTSVGLVGVGGFRGNRLALFDETGAEKRTFAPVPAAPDGMPSVVWEHALKSWVRPDPSLRRLAVATHFSDRLEIFDLDGRLLVEAERPFGFEPAFEVAESPDGGPALESGPELRFGYIDLATSATAIYALFSGRTRVSDPGRSEFGEYVHVFDWDGRLRQVWKLKRAAIAIAVDEADGELFAIHHDPKPLVARYELPLPSEPAP